MKENTIIINGKLMTMDEKGTADWMVIERNRILEVGTGDDYKTHLTNRSKVIDARGGSVTPGFIDSHFHVVMTAVSDSWVSLEGVKNYRAAGKKLKSAYSGKKGELIIGTKLDPQYLEEGEMPGRTILDKYCKDAPVAVYSADYKILALNTYGILYFKVPFSLNGVEVDDSGMPTGIFTDQAGAVLDNKIFSAMTDEDRKKAVDRLVPQLFGLGLTTVAAMEGGNMSSSFDESPDAEFIYKYGENYKIAMELFYQTTDIRSVIEKGLHRIGGALYVDGTIGGRTAALCADYSDAPGKKGIYSIPPSQLRELVAECYRNNLQVGLDAIGDGAIEECLKAFEYAEERYPARKLRGRIEHAEMITQSQMLRAEKLGVILSMQPTYEGLWGGAGKMYQHRLGERYKQTNAFREILDCGIVLCGGSDSNVTDPNPMLGIHYAVNHPVKRHRITVEEAIRMYTASGAYGLFLEEHLGSLTAGKYADAVIFPVDLKSTDPKSLKTIRPLCTIKAGEIVFDRGVYHVKD